MPLDAHANASRGIDKFIKANLTKHQEVFLKCSRRKKRRIKHLRFPFIISILSRNDLHC